MFKSYREFTLDKPIDTKRLKVRFTRESYDGMAYTLVQLHDTVVVSRQNVNNICTLNTGGWYTPSTKTVINTALRLIYGKDAPVLYQSKGKWYIEFKGGHVELFFDGIVIGGGCGAAFAVLN